MPLSPGTRLGSYEIVSPLGAGGMGEVYKAKDLKLGRDVAIKVLREDLASDREGLMRFKREARAASALNHPAIVHIYDIGEKDGTRYIAMEHVDGKTLRDMLGDGPLPIERLLPFAIQIAEGLAKAHSAGIVHRDLKPENLMVNEDGFVKILDFGLAKLVRQSVSLDSDKTTGVETQPGAVMGTVHYMSPEQARGRSVDYRSDQFSFGAILYEMATGELAFGGETVTQILAAVKDDEPEPMGRLDPKIPAPLRAVVERCLSKLPEERYESAWDLASALKRIPHTTQASRVRRRVGAVALMGVGAALIVVILRSDFDGSQKQLPGVGTVGEKVQTGAQEPAGRRAIESPSQGSRGDNVSALTDGEEKALAPAPQSQSAETEVTSPPAGPRQGEVDPRLEADREAVREVLRRYEVALETRSLDALKTIWPGMKKEFLEGYKEAFSFSRSWEVSIQVLDTQVVGDTATVVCRRRDSILTKDKQQLQDERSMTFKLIKLKNSWFIEETM